MWEGCVLWIGWVDFAGDLSCGVLDGGGGFAFGVARIDMADLDMGTGTGDRTETEVDGKAGGLSVLLGEGKGVVLDGALATYLEVLGAGMLLFPYSLQRGKSVARQQPRAY